jgi:hypothetical protein
MIPEKKRRRLFMIRKNKAYGSGEKKRVRPEPVVSKYYVRKTYNRANVHFRIKGEKTSST